MGFELSNGLTTFILVSLIAVALFIPLVDLSNSYDVNITDDLNDTLASMNEGFEELTVMNNQIQNVSQGTSASQTTVSGFSFEGAVASIKIMFNSFGIINNMLSVYERILGIPPIFKIALLGIISIVLTLAFVSTVFGRRLGT